MVAVPFPQVGVPSPQKPCSIIVYKLQEAVHRTLGGSGVVTSGANGSSLSKVRTWKVVAWQRLRLRLNR